MKVSCAYQPFYCKGNAQEHEDSRGDRNTTRSKVKQTACPPRDAVFRQLRIPLGSNPTGAYHHAPPRALLSSLLLLDRQPRSRSRYRVRRAKRKREEKEEMVAVWLRGETLSDCTRSLDLHAKKNGGGRSVGWSVDRSVGRSGNLW